jgi:DNA-binding CsgD family transcriptional regulator
LLFRLINTDLSMLKGPTFLVAGKKYRVGRSSECAFVVRDLSVSRFHAELIVNQDDVLVKDLGSMNGTFVDGVRTGQAEVKAGQTVVFGSAQFRLTSHEIVNHVTDDISDESTCAIKGKPGSPDSGLQRLSGLQRRVLHLLLTGLSEKEVAVQLGRRTIHYHVREIYRALKVNSRAELMARFVSDSKFRDKPAP